MSRGSGESRGSGTTLLVIAKAPVAGRVKTRLMPEFAPAEAAELAAAALRDTLAVGLAVPAVRRLLVLDGAPGDWVPPGYEVAPQVAGGLDERLAGAFALCDGPALLVGMDTPQLTSGLLAPALGAGGWDGCDAWFGPAADGGFWALGLAEPARPDLLLGVPMSTARTGAVQRARLTAAGLRVRDLPRLRDVDTPADATEVAALAPRTHFATTLRAIRPGTPVPSRPYGNPPRPVAPRARHEAAGAAPDGAGTASGRTPYLAEPEPATAAAADTASGVAPEGAGTAPGRTPYLAEPEPATAAAVAGTFGAAR